SRAPTLYAETARRLRQVRSEYGCCTMARNAGSAGRADNAGSAGNAGNAGSGKGQMDATGRIADSGYKQSFGDFESRPAERSPNAECELRSEQSAINPESAI